VTSWSVVGILCVLAFSFFYASAYYSLRAFSRIRLEELLTRWNKPGRLDYLQEHSANLLLICSNIRTAANIALVTTLIWVTSPNQILKFEVLIQAFIAALLLLMIFSVALPHAIAKYASESFLGRVSPALFLTEKISSPLLALMRAVDELVRRMLGVSAISEI